MTPAETIGDMRDADLFRTMLPARHGGFEYDFTVMARILYELAQGCGSSAWVGGLAIAHQWLVANFPMQAQEDVWGDDPSAIVFGSYAAAASVWVAPGGYRISGSWAFSSGCDHGQWALVGVLFPPDDARAAPYPGLMLVPAGDYAIDDGWRTVGLAATGRQQARGVRENGGDKLVHGSGGNVPSAGGAKLCHL